MLRSSSKFELHHLCHKRSSLPVHFRRSCIPAAATRSSGRTRCPAPRPPARRDLVKSAAPEESKKLTKLFLKQLLSFYKACGLYSPTPWSSLDKESVVIGPPDNFPVQQKDGFFCKAIILILFKKATSVLLNWEVIWRASNYP